MSKPGWTIISPQGKTMALPHDAEEKMEATLPASHLEATALVAASKKLSKKRFVKKGRGKDFSALEKLGKVSIADGARAGLQALKFIKTFLNVETKMFDFNPTFTVTTRAGVVDSISDIAEGNDYNNRSGNSILCQRISIRGSVVSSAVATSISEPAPLVRFMLLRDMLFTTGTDPTPAQIMELVGTSSSVFSPMLHVHDGNQASRRFRVLFDRTFALVPPYATTIATTSTATVDSIGRDTQFFEADIKVGAHIEFQGTAGSDASAWVGHCYAFYISNATTNGPLVTYYTRLYFTDN
jgi:hypothetical protein